MNVFEVNSGLDRRVSEMRISEAGTLGGSENIYHKFSTEMPLVRMWVYGGVESVELQSFEGDGQCTGFAAE